MNRHLMKVVLSCVFALQTMVPGAAWSAATASVPVLDDLGTPRFAKEGGAVPLPGSRTIPYYTFVQQDPTNKVTYPITYVGASPILETRTVVPTVVIPLTMRFDNGVVLDGAQRAADAVASPIFQSFDYGTPIGVQDVGQYGDVFMRAQANRIGTNYHVELGAPVVLGAVTIDVPKNQGFGANSGRTGAPLGLVDIVWLSARLQNLISSLHIDPASLPMFVTDNTFLYEGNDPGNCCVLGYHGAGHPTGYGAGNVNSNGNAPIQTYMWASLNTPGIFGSPYIADIHALSHEVAEWLDDPFITNYVQPWLTPTAPQYGCTPILETGDPVVGIGFNLGPWHPEDEVFGQWFLREDPSSAFGGRYTLMGPYNPYAGFHAPATGC